MENENDYKQEIRNTRVGCLGSSDAQILMSVASNGVVPNSAHKRLAVVKGIAENKEIPQNAAINAGNEMEMAIFNHLSANDNRYQSNPLWVSERYSRKNVKLISHPDIVLADEKTETLYVYEVKTTKYNVETTKHAYKGQMFIHLQLANEKARWLGKKWKVKLFLVHYSTEGLDIENGITFDPTRLTVSPVRISSRFFDLGKTMDIIDDFLEDFTEFYEETDVCVETLPTEVRDYVQEAAMALREIEEQERKVKELKERLYAFLVEKDIKSIKNEEFTITRVDPSESVGFDYKRYLDDYEKKYPRKVKKLIRDYEKRTARNGFAKITLRNKNK